MGVHCVRGTYCRPGGQPGGSEVETLGVRMDSGAHWMGHRTMSSGRMGSGSWLSSSGVWRREHIRFQITGSGSVRDGEMDACKEQSPSSLMWV